MPHQFLGSGFPKKIEGHQVSMYEQGALVLSSGLKNGDGGWQGRASPALDSPGKGHVGLVSHPLSVQQPLP